MKTPTCYVMSAAELHTLVQSFALIVLLVVVGSWVVNLDWWSIEHRWRRWRRRRRLRAIRAAAGVSS